MTTSIKFDIDPDTGLAKDMTGDALVKARRAVGGGDSSNGGAYRFDGTQDYQAWKRYANMQAILAGNGAQGSMAVFRLLTGNPADVVTADAAVATATTWPFTSQKDIFDILDLQYGASTALNKADAMERLTRLRQGNRALGEHVGEFNSLAAQSGVSEDLKTAMFRASVKGSLAAFAAALPTATMPELVLAMQRYERVAPRNPTHTKNKVTKGRGGQSDKETRKCYNCEIVGHLASQCTRQKKPKTSKGRKGEEDHDDDASSIVSYSPNE